MLEEYYSPLLVRLQPDGSSGLNCFGKRRQTNYQIDGHSCWKVVTRMDLEHRNSGKRRPTAMLVF
jgi:hypothetical protein